MKRIIFVVMLTMVAGMLFGGGDQESAAGGEELLTLTYWVPLHPTATQVLTSFNESHVYQKMEELTGIRMEFVHPASGQQQEQFNLMIASNDLTDIIGNMAHTYRGGPDKAIADGVYLRLNELIDEHAPNYAAIRGQYPDIARQTITDEGNIYSFNQLQLLDTPPWFGMFIREDLLEEAGLPVPVTIDEWETALRAFKEMGVERPLFFRFDQGFDISGVFAAAYETDWSFMRRGSEVVYGPIEPGYREFLATLNRWYEEGLLDSEFLSRDNQSRNAAISNSEIGSFPMAYAMAERLQDALHANGYPDARFAPAPYPSLDGTPPRYRQVNNPNNGFWTAITSNNPDPAATVAWFDYGYGEDGYLLYNFGGELGTTYTLEPGEHYFVDGGIPVESDIIRNNPDMPRLQARWVYRLHNGPFLKAFETYPFEDLILESMDTWQQSATTDAVLPPIFRTDEESRRFSAIMSDIETYREETTFRFVIGLEPLDQFDAYVEQILSMGIEEAIAIQQAALDRYNER